MQKMMMIQPDNINKEDWDKRSIDNKNNIKSVLFKRFPEALNNHIHNFHKKIILETITDKNNLRILDLGCGYGRNAIPILQRNTGAEIVGIDISNVFIELYKENTGQPGFVNSIEELPDDLGKFDYILCITVLMYIERSSINKVIRNMLAHLKKDGKIILIEPLASGYLFSSGFGLLQLFSRNSKNKFSNCFKKNELTNCINNYDGIILDEKRIPITTIFIIPLYLISLLFGKTIMDLVFKIISRSDVLLCKTQLPSLYSALVTNMKTHE